MADSDDLAVAPHRGRRKANRLASPQLDEGLFQLAGPDLRTLQVLKQGDVALLPVGGELDRFSGVCVECRIPMREVEAGDVHAGRYEAAQHGRRRAGRPQRADDLGTAHLQVSAPVYVSREG